MSLLIDTPRWPWRGHLWAHMISDESLDELHDAARGLGLRWLSFGRDHYDVPDVLWNQACEVAAVVDSRDIVRSLRRTGLRVPGGKPVKAWRRATSLPDELVDGALADWLAELGRSLGPTTSIDVLERPGELVVFHMTDRSEGPGEIGAPDNVHTVETVVDGRYSIEVVLATD